MSGYFFAGSKPCGLTIQTCTGLPSAPGTMISSAGLTSTSFSKAALCVVRRLPVPSPPGATGRRQSSGGLPIRLRAATANVPSGASAHASSVPTDETARIAPVARTIS